MWNLATLRSEGRHTERGAFVTLLMTRRKLKFCIFFFYTFSVWAGFKLLDLERKKHMRAEKDVEARRFLEK